MLELELSRRLILMPALVQCEENYLGECVSSSTAKGVHHGSRLVADGLDLHSTTNTGDWLVCVREWTKSVYRCVYHSEARGGGLIFGEEGSCGGGELS
ncbi:hypothetical protein NC652_027115 [Populus alba x Populus x berolinensis]|nr:hypothetical protein NC652_027115 [Populus alba x Populus x berolinensis]